MLFRNGCKVTCKECVFTKMVVCSCRVRTGHSLQGENNNIYEEEEDDDVDEQKYNHSQSNG